MRGFNERIHYTDSMKGFIERIQREDSLRGFSVPTGFVTKSDPTVMRMSSILKYGVQQ